MIRKSKFFIGSLLITSMIMGSVGTSYADESVVSKTEDNISITKSVEWTTVDGKSVDENGNPYVKINFKIDATKATTEISTINGTGDIDVCFLIDTSKKMDTKLDKAKVDAKTLASKLLEVNNSERKLRIALDHFADKLYQKTDTNLINDIGTLQTTIDNYTKETDLNGSALHKGLYEACDLFNAQSKAENKYIVVFTQGDITMPEMVRDELPHAHSRNSNLKIITIGYETDFEGSKFLEEIADKKNGRKLYYESGINTTYTSTTARSVSSDMQSVYDEMVDAVTSYVTGNKLEDTIPAEFSLVEGTLTSNDTNVAASVGADNKTLIWDWGTNKLEKKVYEMSAVTILDKSKLIEGCTKVYTNGTTVDTTKDSSNSAIFSYNNASKKIGLQSPILTIEEKKVTVKENAKDALEMDATPATGDSSQYLLTIIGGAIALISMITVSIIAKRRRY